MYAAFRVLFLVSIQSLFFFSAFGQKGDFKSDSIKIRDLLQIAAKNTRNDKSLSIKKSKEALKLADNIQSDYLMGLCYNQLGDSYWYASDDNNASIYYFDALKRFQKLNDKPQLATCYRNIGWIYLGQKKFKEAEKYFKLSLSIYIEIKDDKRQLIIYDDLGQMYTEMGDIPKALEATTTSIELSKKYKLLDGLGATYFTLGKIYTLRGDLKSAIAAYEESIKLLSKFKDENYNVCACHSGIAEAYFEAKEYYKGIDHAEQAIYMSSKYDFPVLLVEATYIMAKLQKAVGNYQKAVQNMEIYSITKDSINANNNRNFVQETAAKMEEEQNQLKIKNLTRERELADLKLSKEFNFKILLISIILILFAFGFFLFRSYKRKNRDNNALSSAYNLIEEKNKDISDSIAYALQIQRARLPRPGSIQHSFPESFGLYLPRDIVSGDFYWYAENDNNQKIFAVADCTGHGIPGAFMSMIGIDSLNYAVLEKRLESTAEILKEVNKLIKKSLKQEGKDATSRDGMDIGICIYSEDKKRLKYSGAFRPLWIVRNKTLLEFSPDKVSIGGLTDSDYEFKESDIELIENDIVYLFTDGFADQFGGPNNKKFMSKNLKNLIIDISELPLHEQELKLKNAFDKWRGDHPQIDDVLVTALKV